MKKDILKLFVISFLSFVMGIIFNLYVTSIDIDQNIKNTVVFIKKLLFTSDGNPDSSVTITIDGENGDISMDGNLNIKEGAIKDNTIISEDIKDGTIKQEDIGKDAIGPDQLQDSIDVSHCGPNQVILGNGKCVDYNYTCP